MCEASTISHDICTPQDWCNYICTLQAKTSSTGSMFLVTMCMFQNGIRSAFLEKEMLDTVNPFYYPTLLRRVPNYTCTCLIPPTT